VVNRRGRRAGQVNGRPGDGGADAVLGGRRLPVGAGADRGDDVLRGVAQVVAVVGDGGQRRRAQHRPPRVADRRPRRVGGDDEAGVHVLRVTRILRVRRVWRVRRAFVWRPVGGRGVRLSIRLAGVRSTAGVAGIRRAAGFGPVGRAAVFFA